MNLSNLILIGASTGGPGRIYSILESIEPNFVGTIVIAQHMNESFFESFVHQLRVLSALPVSLVTSAQTIQSNHVYVCSTTSQLLQTHDSISIVPSERKDFSYNPQIDYLFSSAALLSPKYKRLGIVLTGIGEDGAIGALELYRAGGLCVFESEKSAIVYGMPRRAKELVPDGYSMDIDEIIEFIHKFGRQ